MKIAQVFRSLLGFFLPCMLVFSACSTTVVSTTTSTQVAGTTTIPSGNVRVLFDALIKESIALAVTLNSSDTAGAERHLSDIDAIWIALEPQVKNLGDQTLGDIRRMIDLMHDAVDRNIPADADKAVKFLLLLSDGVPA